VKVKIGEIHARRGRDMFNVSERETDIEERACDGGEGRCIYAVM
jgi:hypothetical protein